MKKVMEYPYWGLDAYEIDGKPVFQCRVCFEKFGSNLRLYGKHILAHSHEDISLCFDLDRGELEGKLRGGDHE